MNGTGSRSSHSGSVQFGSLPAMRTGPPEASPFMHLPNPRAPEFSGLERTNSQAVGNGTHGRQEANILSGQQQPNGGNGQGLTNAVNRQHGPPRVQFGQHEHIDKDDYGQRNGTFGHYDTHGMNGPHPDFSMNGNSAQRTANGYHDQSTTDGSHRYFSTNDVYANWGVRGNHEPNGTNGYYSGTLMNSPPDSSSNHENGHHTAPNPARFTPMGPPPPGLPPHPPPGNPPPPTRLPTPTEAFAKVYNDLRTASSLSDEEIWAGLGSVRIDLTQPELTLSPPELFRAMSTLASSSGQALLFHPNGSVSARAAGTPRFKRMRVGDGRSEECGDQYAEELELFEPGWWKIMLKPGVEWKLPD